MKRVSPVAAAMASAAGRFSPRLRMVSIIPGMDTGAPDRTDRSRGTGPAPKLFSIRCSSPAIRAVISSPSSDGIADPDAARYSRQARVEMTKPSGTGSPAWVILARPAPFPPSRSTSAGSASVKVSV